jgi:hypothetical protein
MLENMGGKYCINTAHKKNVSLTKRLPDKTFPRQNVSIHNDYSIYCTVGWVYFGPFFKFSTKVPLRFFYPVTASSLVPTFWVMHYIRIKFFFFRIWTSWVSKDLEFYVDFTNINFPWWQNEPKKLFKKKEFIYYTGGPLWTDENLYHGISFLGAFCPFLKTEVASRLIRDCTKISFQKKNMARSENFQVIEVS